MPQMSSMDWLLLLIYFITVFYLFMILLYFLFNLKIKNFNNLKIMNNFFVIKWY
nr:ATP synthase F0 subunit 8 [Aphidius gifuensis]WLE66240.1 ATP synthase F0 subunit 8 [Aphidius gifuensis]WLE66370.1 ATP synthase F0 subunit 8 [Aphidius gifuensis]WLE66383.1 ATP synthase F0 subunit 8 [Aphidius gifuensis]WLE66396.1 ATP synthase F0 subunit 8 [Aphidius gifuensis]